jgi:AraC-like DNA-binding protein
MPHSLPPSNWTNARVSTGQVAIAEVRYQPGGTCGPRTQRFYQLVLLHSGSCRVMVDKEIRELAVDTLYLFHPGHRETWEFSPTRETHHSWCEIKPSCMPEKLRLALRAAPLAVSVSPVWKHLLATALELRSNHDPAVFWEIEFLGLTMFAEFLSSAGHAEMVRRGDDGVHKAMHTMQTHLGEADCLRQAELASGMSRNVLIRRFQSQFQITPSRYLWRLRTERGIAMLRETGHSVAEIAYSCGFKDPFHFSHCVKRSQGVPPRQIRQSAWQGASHEAPR